MSGRLIAAPIAFEDAAAFVREHHRHHTPPQGHKFSIAAILGDSPIGSNQDERHAAIKAFVEARMDGRPHLSVVEGTSHEQ